MKNPELNLTSIRHKFSLRNKISRLLWNITCVILYKPFALRIFRKWRVFLLKMFGAKISWSCTVHSSAKIWAPWNLKIGSFSCLGPDVDCYNQGKITIGSNVTISQKVYLCASTHDYTDPLHPLVLAPIEIKNKVWVAADSFIGPGVIIGEGAVVGARASVFKQVLPWQVVGGNPAKFIKTRELKNDFHPSTY